MFREKIRKTIYERELKVDKVAKDIGVNTANLYAYIKGTRNINLKQLDKLVHYLGALPSSEEGFIFDPDNIPKFNR